MKVLVTGQAGFVGFHVSRELLERGDDVVGVDNFSEYYDIKLKEDRNRLLIKYDSFKDYRIDISDYNSLEGVFKKEKIDRIVHMAAQPGVRYSIEHPFVYEKANLNGFLNILECARHNSVDTFVYASSSSVYGGNKKIPFKEDDPVETPVSLYGATKRANELMAYTYHHLYGLQTTGLRLFTVYGPWTRPDMALYKFAKFIKGDMPIDVYGQGDMRRDFTYVDDIVQGVLAALEKSYDCEVFNLGRGKPVELTRFIELIEEYIGKKAKRNMMEMQQGDVLETYADISKARRMLRYTPRIDVEEGIRNFVDWFNEYY